MGWLIVDVAAAYRRAVNAIRIRGARPTRQAIATELGVDQATVERWARELDLVYPPKDPPR